MATNFALKSLKNNVPARSFFCHRDEYERILAFGTAMGWDERPFDFVVQQYRDTLATR